MRRLGYTALAMVALAGPGLPWRAKAAEPQAPPPATQPELEALRSRILELRRQLDDRQRRRKQVPAAERPAQGEPRTAVGLEHDETRALR